MSTTSTVADVGTAMPELTLTDATGVSDSLHHLQAGRGAVVYFMRASTCPVCLRHARALAALATDGRLGDVRVVLVAPGGAVEAAQVAAKVTGAAVAVRASGAGHAAAGLGTFLNVQHSGTFLIDGQGMVRYRRTSALPPRSFVAQELIAALPR